MEPISRLALEQLELKSETKDGVEIQFEIEEEVGVHELAAAANRLTAVHSEAAARRVVAATLAASQGTKVAVEDGTCEYTVEGHHHQAAAEAAFVTRCTAHSRSFASLSEDTAVDPPLLPEPEGSQALVQEAEEQWGAPPPPPLGADSAAMPAGVPVSAPASAFASHGCDGWPHERVHRQGSGRPCTDDSDSAHSGN